MEKVKSTLSSKLAREEKSIRKKQEVAMTSLVRRIQRDRDSQVKNREVDQIKLIQRNKNVLSDLVKKHQAETKRTKEFLKYALGKREQYDIKSITKAPKSTVNLFTGAKFSGYGSGMGSNIAGGNLDNSISRSIRKYRNSLQNSGHKV